jgi:hypothetical protein
VHLIIDSDPICYRAGFASERTDYHLVVESAAGDITELYFTPKPGAHAGAQMQKWLKAHEGYTVLDKQRVVHPDPEEYAIEATRTQIQSIEKEVREHYRIDSFDRITVILSGPGNYREKIATVFPYKGNRDPEHKPYWYQAIRNHLTNDWGASVIHGREADDECSILARQHDDTGAYVIATIDKDLDQIPGYHYNYLKQVHYKQGAIAAYLFFWQQVLSGDSTDGVPGCWRCGDVSAQKFMEKYASARLPFKQGTAIWNGIIQKYKESQSIAGCPYADREPGDIALETARLVYLQKHEGELWNPPGMPMGTLEEYLDE